MARVTKKATTPVGKTEWFSLTKPDQFGNYTAVLHLDDAPETHQLISLIDSVGEGRMPYEQQEDGSFKIRVKGKSKGQKKTGEQYVINPPVLYNALGKVIDGLERQKLNVGNGSEMRANLEFSSYAMIDQETQELMKGVSCKIKSAQLGKIKEHQAEDAGFDAMEMAIEAEGGEASEKNASDF